MSNKLPMTAVDKVEVKFTMNVETVVKLDKVRAKFGLKSRSAIFNSFIDEDVKDVPLTEKDLQRINQIIQENIRKRNAAKAKKGLL